MHIDTDKALAWLDRLRDGVENQNSAAELVVTQAMAAQSLYKAARAHHAWSYCEHHGLGSFNVRGSLCSYAEHLTAVAMAKAEGRETDQQYTGAKQLIVWPYVALEETSIEDAEAIVCEALEHERAKREASLAGE